MSTHEPATASWKDWSCTVRVAVRADNLVGMAVAQTQALMLEVEHAASRFLRGSELNRLNARAGRVTPVSPLMLELVVAALEAAEDTDGACDPTVGAHVAASGYDHDIEVVQARSGLPTPEVASLDADRSSSLEPADWRRVLVNTELGLVGVPAGLSLDLGSAAKAWTADRAAALVHRQVGGPVLVEVGGDVSVAGADDDPFPIRVAEREGQAGEIVDLATGGVATSTTTVRAWRHHGAPAHHIIDPATGLPVEGPWRTATVWAPSALAANAASTAALVKREHAVGWLRAHAPVARLVGVDGLVRPLPGWPSTEVAA